MADSPRWCATCAAYGDHHTDRHDLIVNGVPLPTTYRVNGIEYMIRDGAIMRFESGQWVPISARKRSLFARFRSALLKA